MKAGLPPQADLRPDHAGAGNSRVFELRAPMMVKGNYKDVTMKIDVWDKDMQVIGDYARKIKVPTPMFDAIEAGLHQGDEERPRRAGHRRRLRRAGEDGEGEAQEALSYIRSFPRKRGSRATITSVRESALGPRLRGDERTFLALAPSLRISVASGQQNNPARGCDGLVAAAVGNPRRHADRLERADHHGRRPGAARRRLSVRRKTANIRSC